MKVPRCKHDRIHYCINECDREAIANHIFAVLAAEDAPCIVIGKFGFGLASCLKFMWRFEEQTGTKLGNQVQMQASENQELMCLFKFEKGQSIQNKIFPGIRGVSGLTSAGLAVMFHNVLRKQTT